MQTILSVVAPVFIIIALGYLAATRNMISVAGFRGLNSFTFNLAAPALLFAGGTAGHEGGGLAAFVFFLAALILYAVTLWLARGVLRQPLGEAGLFALNCTYGNTVMMGIPLIAAAYGQAGLSILLAILALHSMVLLGLATIVAELGIHHRAPWRRVLRATVTGVARNPVVMAVILALLWRQAGIAIPDFLRRTLELLGAATSPVALFCLGGSLAGFRAARLADVAWAVPLKLLALPALVWLLARWFALPPFDTAVAVTAAALPTGANAFLLARRYETAAAPSGATVLVSTLLSVLTLAATLAWFGAGG